MARGFSAGEGRFIRGTLDTTRTAAQAAEARARGDNRTDAQVRADAEKVDKLFADAINKFFNLKTGGFGAGEEARTVAWMPKADEMPSKVRPGNYDSSEEAASADARAIMKAMPAEVKVALQEMTNKERERMQKNIGEINENGVSAKLAAALEKSNPDAYEALKNIATRIAVSRQADIKKEIDERRRASDTFDEAYENAWNAAREAFSNADEVAKMVLKKGDESYGETREFVGTKGGRGDKEIVGTLKNGEPSISGRVLAVNGGILMARRAAEEALSKLAKVNDKHNKKSELKVEPVTDAIKDDVLRLVTEKIIADKGAFLSVRGYIPPTAIYIGPVHGTGFNSKNPVQHIQPVSGRFDRDIQAARLGVD